MTTWFARDLASYLACYYANFSKPRYDFQGEVDGIDFDNEELAKGIDGYIEDICPELVGAIKAQDERSKK